MAKDSKMMAKEMIERMRNKRGILPSFLEILAEEFPDLLVEHVHNKRFAMEYTELDDRYKILICLGAAAIMGDEEMVESFIRSGKTHGVPKEEMVQAILLARFVKSSTVLKSSAKGMALLNDMDEENKQ